jgi:hypothetical protein
LERSGNPECAMGARILFLRFWQEKSLFYCYKKESGKKIVFRVKSILLSCPTNRRSIVLISD